MSPIYETHLVVADGFGHANRDGISIHDVGKSGSRLLRFIFSVLRVYRKACELHCDLYHIHDPELLTAALALTLKGYRVGYDVHEDYPRHMLTKKYMGFTRSFVPACFEWFENWASKKLSLIITATPYLKDRFLKVNRNTESVRNLPMLIDVVESPSPHPSSKLAYVGGIREDSGLLELMEVVEDLPIELELAGPFESAAFERKIRSLRGWQKVNYHGVVDRSSVRSILRSSFAGIVINHAVPNYVNSAPTKLFEYMAAGIPVVCAHFPYIREVVEESNCGICVDPADIKAVANAIMKLYSDPALASRLGANGLRAARSRYNWESEKVKLLRAYHDTLQDSKTI